jgi:hypothetical protein
MKDFSEKLTVRSMLLIATTIILVICRSLSSIGSSSECRLDIHRTTVLKLWIRSRSWDQSHCIRIGTTFRLVVTLWKQLLGGGPGFSNDPAAAEI